MSIATTLAIAAITISQGQATLLEIDDEPMLVAVAIEWNQLRVPLARREQRWAAVIGVDLDTEPGEHRVPIERTFASGAHDRRFETISVTPREFPTTRLTVEPRYVDLDPADQARAARESAEIAEIYRAVTPEALWRGEFVSPIPGTHDGRNFGHRRVFNGQARAPHSGADLRASLGTAVHASNRGRVVLAKDLFFSGNAVFLDHGAGVYSTYLHLSQIDVSVGEIVEKGSVIGLSGATGRVTGPHLHWGSRILDARVDPFTLLELSER